MPDSVRVKCGVCGRSAAPEEFVLDLDYKKMVCPFCIREKKLKEKTQREQEAVEKGEFELKRDKPFGYDKEDEYLERLYKEKMKSAVTVERIDDERVKYRCPKCNYVFVYNLIKKMPAKCHYCDSSIVVNFKY